MSDWIELQGSIWNEGAGSITCKVEFKLIVSEPSWETIELKRQVLALWICLSWECAHGIDSFWNKFVGVIPRRIGIRMIAVIRINNLHLFAILNFFNTCWFVFQDNLVVIDASLGQLSWIIALWKIGNDEIWQEDNYLPSYPGCDGCRRLTPSIQAWSA